jgi:hypothetical protein
MCEKLIKAAVGSIALDFARQNDDPSQIDLGTKVNYKLMK